MAPSNPTRTPAGFLTFFAGLIFLFIFGFLMLAWVRSTGPKDDLAAKRAAARMDSRQKLDETHRAQAMGLGWADKAKGVAHVPVTEAMKLTLAELKAKKVAASAVKVEPPLPAIVLDPKSTEPPPVAMPSAPQGAELQRYEVAAASLPAPAAVATPAPSAVPAPAAPPVPAATPSAPAPGTGSPAPKAESAAPVPMTSGSSPTTPAATATPSTPAAAPPAETPVAPAPAPAPAPAAPAIPAAATPAAPSVGSPAPAAAAPVNLTPQLAPISGTPPSP